MTEPTPKAVENATRMAADLLRVYKPEALDLFPRLLDQLATYCACLDDYHLCHELAERLRTGSANRP